MKLFSAVEESGLVVNERNTRDKIIDDRSNMRWVLTRDFTFVNGLVAGHNSQPFI